jgi:hypothetical protein
MFDDDYITRSVTVQTLPDVVRVFKSRRVR